MPRGVFHMSSSESKRSPQDNQHYQNLSIDELLPNLYDWDENLVAIADPFDIALEGLNTTTTTTTTERVEHPPAGSETIIWKQSVVVKPSGPLQRLDVANAMMKIRGARGSNTKRASKTTRANPPPPNKVSSTSQQAGEGSSSSSSSKKKKKEKTSSKYRGVTKHCHTGKFEAHLWNPDVIRPNHQGRRKGKQIYLGQYQTEEEAARMYDRAVLSQYRDRWTEEAARNNQSAAGKKRSVTELLGLNFDFGSYLNDCKVMRDLSNDDYLARLKMESKSRNQAAAKAGASARKKVKQQQQQPQVMDSQEEKLKD